MPLTREPECLCKRGKLETANIAPMSTMELDTTTPAAQVELCVVQPV